MGNLRKLSAFFALALTFAAASSTVAAQSESANEDSSAQPISVHFEIVVDTLSSSRQSAVVAEIERQFGEVATANGLVRANSPAADLVIRLEFSQPDPKVDVFVIHSVAVYAGDVLRRDAARTCMQCTASEIAADGLTILMPAVEEVKARRAEAVAQAETETETAEPPPIVEVAPTPRDRSIGAPGYVGTASSAVGLGSVVAGAVLISRGSVPNATGLLVTDYRPAGQALVGVGLGLMVVGNVLLAVDLAVLEPRRHSRSRARVDGVAIVAADGPGVVVSGRF